MDPATLVIVGLVIVTALTFDFTNGFHDTANAMATSIATGALKPKTAVIAAGTLNLVGAFLSVEVAKTISGGLINEQVVTIAPEFILAGLIGAIIWNLLTWLVGLPSSSSHALFGGLVGAVIIGAGVEGVNFAAVITKILVPALVSPIVAGPNEFVPACEGGPDSLKCYRLGSILPPVRPGGLTLPPWGQTGYGPPLQGAQCAPCSVSPPPEKFAESFAAYLCPGGKQGERARLHMRPHVRNIAHRSVSTENKRKSFSARA